MLNINKKYALKNYWENNNPRSFMLHTTGGRGVEGAVTTLKARKLSYNYIIDNGKIYELVNWKNSAWHAGVIKRPNLRARAFFNTLKGKDNPNRNSVGVSFTYPTGGDITILPEEDVNACVFLMKKVGKEASVRYTADNTFYHKEVTIYKPAMVKGYREQVLDALIGDKDPKDALQKTILRLTIEVLKLKLKLLLSTMARK